MEKSNGTLRTPRPSVRRDCCQSTVSPSEIVAVKGRPGGISSLSVIWPCTVSLKKTESGPSTVTTARSCGLHLASEADREKRDAAGGEELRDFEGRFAFVVLAIAKKNHGGFLGIHLGDRAVLDARGQVRDVPLRLGQVGRHDRILRARLPDLLGFRAHEIEQLHIVVFGKLREERFLAAFHEQSLEALRARHGVEFRERGLERRIWLRSQRANVLVETLPPFRLPARSGIGEIGAGPGWRARGRRVA